MATRKNSRTVDARLDPDVTALVAALDHPLARDIDAVRRILLGASPEIAEAVKWNAPSYRTADFFATIHVRSRDAVQVVLHTGAKKKAAATDDLAVEDPEGLVRWLAKDRGMVTLGQGDEVAAKRHAFEELVRSWLRAL